MGFWGLWGKFYAKKTFHHESSISWLSTLRLLMLTIAIRHFLENDYRNQAHEKNNKFQVTKVFFFAYKSSNLAYVLNGFLQLGLISDISRKV